MKMTLILMRHAKAAHPEDTADHDRPLAERGREAAAAMGRWLAGEGIQPDLAIHSSALRTRETWEGVREGAGWNFDGASERRLYNAPASGIRSVIAGSEGGTILVIGHNPGIGELAVHLAEAAPGHQRFHDYPTAATTVLRFEATDWPAAMRRKGDVAAFAVPADL